jgi:hypothetical protein
VTDFSVVQSRKGSLLFLQCEVTRLASLCRADRRNWCPLLGALLPRQLITGEAVFDPSRHFATAKCRTAKGLLDHLVGTDQERLRKGEAECFCCLAIED